MKRVRGSITIYMLLSGVLAMIMVFTAAESARVQAVNARLKGITFMAADSCFAEYAREIFDDYGIMALWKDEQEFLSSFNRYVQQNLDFTDLDLYVDADLYLAAYDTAMITDLHRITDSRGLVFMDQVYEYMDLFFLEEAASALLSELELFRSGNQVAQFVQKINSYADVFLKVGNTVNKIQSAVDRVRSLANNPRTILGEMQALITRYEETGQSSYIREFNRAYRRLRSGSGNFSRWLDTILTETQNFYRAAEKSDEAVNNLRSQLEENRDVYAEDTVAVISQQLDDLAVRSGGPDTDLYGVGANEQQSLAMRTQLDALEPLFLSIGSGADQESILQYKDLVSGCSESFASFDPDRLGLSAVSERVRQENTGFLSTIRSIFSKGLLNAVTEGPISKQKVSTRELPSKTASGKGPDRASGSIFTAGYRRIAAAEYVLSHFGNYTDPSEETALSYEAEYILGGKASDRENLEQVVRDLVALREGLNMISFLKDPQKTAQAQSLAVSIAGFTGLEALISVIKMVIIGIWCLAESLCDVKTLLRGGRIMAVKEPFDWTVSVIGLKNFSKNVLPAATDSRGLDYRDYLRVLLALEPESDLAYRCMDLIQLNVCRNYQPAFRMQDCISGIDLLAVYHAGPLFAAFPFMRDVTAGSSGAYVFTFPQNYAY